MTPSIASATATPTPQPTVDGPSGEICVAAFDDTDRNGSRQSPEPFLTGALITIDDIDRTPVRELL